MTDVLRVLVTDDEEGMRRGVERVLSRYVASFADLAAEVSYEVSVASTGEEALAAIRESVPDIFLLDYKLPGLSGLDVLAQLGEYHDDLSTVMVTAYASLHTAVEATRNGAFDFLPKPFTPEELKATVRKATRHLLLQRRARHLERERRRVRFELISVVSHELKAPLAAVEGFLNVLEDQNLDAATQRRLRRRCLVRIDGMRKLIGDLLDLTRIESGQRQRQLVSVDLCEAAQRALSLAESAAAERGIELRLTAPEQLVFTADPSEIDIVMNNLVSNAVKYNRDGGSVQARLVAEPEQVRFVVTDTGIGLTEKDAARLGSEFVRIRTLETRDIPGSGLGLSIVKRLANLYGGALEIVSRHGEGSTFAVTLNREQPGHGATEPP